MISEIKNESDFCGRDDSQFCEAEDTFNPDEKEPSNAITVFVERNTDEVFWYSILREVAPQIKFKFFFLVYGDSEKRDSIIQQKINDGLVPSKLLCINSHYDYLLPTESACLKNINDENRPYIFQTYTYSTHNYKLHPENLDSLCFKRSKIVNNNFPFESFLAEYFGLVFDLFLYCILLCEKYKGDNRDYSLICENFYICTSLTDDLDIIADEGKKIIKGLKRQLSIIKEKIKKDDPEIELKKIGLTSEIKKKRIKKDNVYLFIKDSHILKIIDTIIEKFVVATKKTSNRIEPKITIKNDISENNGANKNSLNSLENFLKDTEKFIQCHFLKKIKEDVTKFVMDPLNKCGGSTKKALWYRATHSVFENTTEKGNALVDFVKYMMSEDLEKVFVFMDEKRHVNGNNFEIDLIFSCKNSITWLRKATSSYVSIECKNWKKKVDPKEIHSFEHKLRHTGDNMGIVFARKFSKEVIQTARDISILGSDDLIIGLISKIEIEEYINDKKKAIEIIQRSFYNSCH